jgi:competence protein ComEC
MHVPILRSFTMAAVVVLALLSGRRAISLRGLLLAAAALILAAPEQLLGVSFQMSFAAVLVLIAGYDAMRPALLRLRGEGTPGRRILCHILGLGLTSLLAGAASAPFAAYHFGHFQLYFVLANMIAVPLTAMWIMPAGLLALALMPLGFDGPAFAVMGWGVQAVLWIARTVSAWPAATIAVPHMPDWGLALVASGLIWLGLWRSRLRLAGVLPLLVGLAAPLLVTPPDILISDDARLIALRTAHGLYAQSAGSDRFVRDSWEQYWAAGPLLDLSAGAANDAVTCTGETCLLRPRATGAAALLLRPGASPVCGQTVTLSSEPVRDCPAIDRFAVWRNGSHAIWLGDTGATILSDRETRGARPWVVLGPERRTAPLLPPAQTE